MALAVLAAAGCAEAAAPERDGTYGFDLAATGGVFHWPRERLPVRYWVHPDAGVVRDFVQAGIARWTAQFLYGEFGGVLVDDSAAADVVVFVAPAPPPDGTPTDAPAAVGACEGKTGFDLDANDLLVGAFRVELSWDAQHSDEDVINCLDRLAVHEVGHTLGLFRHSTDESDLMHPAPRVREPSRGDRATAETLYHTPATILPPARGDGS